MGVDVHLVDGTYELFRYHYSPANRDPQRGATKGVLNSLLQLVENGATHIGVATDHVIESYRNELWATYKTGEGVDPDLKAQFPVLEEVLAAAGFEVWPQTTFEADDALAAAAQLAAADPGVDRVIICTPDKDMAQLVGGKVVQWDRRQDKWFDTDGVREKFGVAPASIPDFLALVGDSADGFPGLAGWGAKSAAAVLARYGHIEDIPPAAGQWDITVRGGAKLARVLQDHLEDALLFRTLATLQPDAPVCASVEDLAWRGPQPGFDELAAHLDGDRILERAHRLARR